MSLLLFGQWQVVNRPCRGIPKTKAGERSGACLLSFVGLADARTSSCALILRLLKTLSSPKKKLKKSEIQINLNGVSRKCC
jgi:hypothetical protein